VWFLVLFAVAGIFALAGAYLLAASTYLPLPLPKTRYEREHSSDLKVESFALTNVDAGGKVSFQIGMANDGRSDVRGVTINVLVPDYATSVERLGGDGTWLATSEPTLPEGSGGSIYYTEAELVFYGRSSELLDFEVQLSPVRDFPVRLKLASAELPKKMEASTTGLGVSLGSP
jgi:hypothetical protein